MKYKVVIPTAGLEARLKTLSKHVKKALVSIGNKPAISYVIEKFPVDIELVIPIGYKKETVMGFLQMVYPDRKFTFVNVDRYEGEGSGLGYSLLCAKDVLQCPFIFCYNDTLVTESIPEPEEIWMGHYCQVEDTSPYRSIIKEGGLVKEICSKGASGDVSPYIGLAGIKDYQAFWQAMEEGKNEGSIEIGESYGLKFLISQGIGEREFDWYDSGNLEALNRAREHFNCAAESYNILEKEDEAIWFVNNKVIKYSVNKKFIADRVERTKYLGNYVPQITAQTENMYSYNLIESEVFSKMPSVFTFRFFLECM
ncbi:MAG: hypothetical protein IT292_09980 [Deltaproteobacteria bacterium]|nr:hypothetical protein [Deltaproteobacteria bacterium]